MVEGYEWKKCKYIREGGEGMHISSMLKIEEIALFIASMNKDAIHHVGYCGDEKKEVLHTILHDFSDIGWERSFVVTYEDNKIIGVLGFDVDEVKKCAEIWGPFIEAENWEEVALHMMKEIELCLNTNNDRAMKLYKKVGFEEKACLQHYIIE